MTDSDAVLAANLEFYRAFTTRDVAAMDALMGAAGAGRLPSSGLDRADGPGGDHRELGRDPRQPACAAHRLLRRARPPYGEAALVLCEEELDGGTLAASNLFVREDDAWRIAHHHAGQIVRRHAERRRPSRLN